MNQIVPYQDGKNIKRKAFPLSEYPADIIP